MADNISVFSGREKINKGDIHSRLGSRGGSDSPGRITRSIYSDPSKMSREVTVISGREQRTFRPRRGEERDRTRTVTETVVENKTPGWVWIVIIILVILLIIAIILWLLERGDKSGIGESCSSSADCATGLFCGGSGSCQATNCLLPASPTNLALEAVGNSQIDATWTAIGEATSYVLYTSKIPNFIFPDDVEAGSSTLTTSGSLTELTPGSEYFVRVASVNSCGQGTLSDAVSIVLPSFPNNVGIKFHADFEITSFLGADGTNVRVKNLCVDDTCAWLFDQITGELKLVDDDTMCLVDNGGNAEIALCTGAADTDKQWVFDPVERNICLLDDSTECLFVANTGDVDSNVSVGNPVLEPDNATSWNITIA